MSSGSGGTGHYKWSWWIEMADAHNIIIIWPNLAGRYNIPDGQFDFGGSHNADLDYGCWDSWNGYIDKESFRTNENKQLKVLHKMLMYAVGDDQ